MLRIRKLTSDNIYLTHVIYTLGNEHIRQHAHHPGTGVFLLEKQIIM